MSGSRLSKIENTKMEGGEEEEEEEGNSSESDLEEESSNLHGKPMTLWTNDDFPNKRAVKLVGLRRLLEGYSKLCSGPFKSKSSLGELDKRDEADYADVEVDSKSCDGVFGVGILVALLVVDIVYVAYATYCNKLKTEDDIRLVWLSVLIWCVILVKVALRLIRLGERQVGGFTVFAQMGDKCASISSTTRKALLHPWKSVWSKFDGDDKALKRKKAFVWKILTGAVMGIFTAFCLIYFVIMKDPRNLVSLSGIIFLLIISVLISRHPSKIRLRPVIGGLFAQLVLAVLTFQTRFGYEVFKFLGDRVVEFLANSKAGADFLFGDLNCMAFHVLPGVIFFSSFISVCFHFGVINVLIGAPSAVITKALGTTGPETINAITESPLVIRPFMHMMTNSELLAIMVNGFASVAGSVMAAYISFGVPANHLLIACVMSAPASLAVAKLIYPETKKAPLAKIKAGAAVKSPYSNALEAAMVGAMDSVAIVTGISANLIAFLSIYSFCNRTLTWLGARACLKRDLTFEVILSYLLWPIAFTMGVPMEDCLKVAELIGTKCMLNEFVAFQKLGVLMEDRRLYMHKQPNSSDVFYADGSIGVTLVNGTQVIFPHGILHTRRAEGIAIYALCGFANIGSVGIMLGVMVTMMPHRRKDLTEMILLGMVGGCIACFLTGCFAGLFYQENA